MTRENARNDINGRYLTDFVPIQRSKKAGKNMYICPVCGSGTGKNGTGACHYYEDTKRIICFANGCFTEKGQDTLGALRTIWQCGETEALERAGYILDKNTTAPTHQGHIKHQEHKEHKESATPDYSAFYKQRHQELKESPDALAYLHGRGITDASIDRFNLGYCASWKHSTSPNSTPTRRIIIPRTRGTYTARNIDAPRNDWEKDRTKQVQGRQKDLFNLEALETAGTPWIIEGEIDAISLYQAGAGAVVAIGTTNNTETILAEAKKHPNAVYILALDNDPDKENGTNPGKDAQRKLAAQMQAAGLDFINKDPAEIYGKAKDGNEAFTSDPERLGKVIASIEAQAKEIKAIRDEERAEELRKRTGTAMLEDFLLSVTDKEARTFEPIRTGIKDIDRALEGGFVRRILVTLSGAPGMGKTAASQWIFENIAAAGTDVLYINLEMDRAQLLARSISRIAWKYDKKDFSALEVLRGYSWTNEQREVITKAAEIYKRDIAPHFIYNPEGTTNRIDSILSVMEAETARIQAQGKPAPLVCIDYLQLIDTGNRDAVEGLKSAIKRLKDFAIDNNTVVLLITANNRTSNKSGVSDMESGRDTSAIEYSADIMLGLSYTAIEDHRKYTYEYTGKDGEKKEAQAEFDLDTIRRLKREARDEGKPVPTVCNEISLKVMKSRFSEDEHRVNLLFDGKHATFTLTEWKFTPTRKAEPPKPKEDEGGTDFEMLGTKHHGKRDKKRKELQEAFARAKGEADAAGTKVTLFALAEILDVSQATAKGYLKEYGGYTISKDGEIVFDGVIDISNTIEAL